MDMRLLIGRGAAVQDSHSSANVEKNEFESKFRKLVEAMNDFISRYNHGNGQVWPAREAQALGKAMRNMERSFGEPKRRQQK
jgi:hypothetical protein